MVCLSRVVLLAGSVIRAWDEGIAQLALGGFSNSFRVLFAFISFAFLMTSLAETATIRCAPARHYLLAARALMQSKMLTGIRLRRQIPVLQNSSEFAYPTPCDTFSPPTLLQPNSELVFEVEMLKIGDETVSEAGCCVQ
jgi:hypothetical protein